MSNTPQITDRGRGPQLAGSRITVMDLVQYFRSDYTYADIREIIPALSDADIASLEEVYRADQAAWDQKDDAVEAYRAEQIRLQNERFPPFQGTHEEYMAYLRNLLQRKQAERNGTHSAR